MMGKRRILQEAPLLLNAYRIVRRSKGIARRWVKLRRASTINGLHTVSIPGYENCWAGYYDHSPFRPDAENQMVLHAVNWPAHRRPNPNARAVIVLVDWKSGDVISKLGETTAWNWQQGSRAHWLAPDTVIYNIYDSSSDAYRAVIVNVDTGERHTLPIAVQESDSKGRIYAISYEALSYIKPEYGYGNKVCSTSDIWEGEITAYDPRNGGIRTLLRVEDLAKEAAERHGQTIRLPKVNHVTASPSGEKLVFVFRYFLGDRRVTDLYLADAVSGGHSCLVADCIASHYCWLDEAALMVTMMGDRGFGYYHLSTEANGAISLFWQMADGHPQTLGGEWIITDTYPDELALRYLFAVPVCDPSRAHMLGAFPEPLFLVGETRCDLHPSVSGSSKWIQVDSTKKGRRTVTILPAPSGFGG